MVFLHLFFLVFRNSFVIIRIIAEKVKLLELDLQSWDSLVR